MTIREILSDYAVAAEEIANDSDLSKHQAVEADNEALSEALAAIREVIKGALPEKMTQRYSSRDVAVNSTGWEVGELDAYDTAIDDMQARLSKVMGE